MTPLCHGYARMGAWSALANATRLFIFPTTSAPIGENLCKALDHTKPLGCPCVPQGDKRLCRRGRSAPANRARHHLRESPSHRSRQCTREAVSDTTQDDGTYELTIGKGYPSLSMYNRDNGSWETSDLYTPHLSLPNAWKCHGRKDDIILHVTGMKTNPVPSKCQSRAGLTSSGT